MRSLGSVLAVSGGLVAAVLGQEPPQFPSLVELITVDVVVLDDGQPVAGLTRDDFSVTEDGEPREIVSFEALVPDAPAPAGGSPVPDRVASNAAARAPGAARAFGILLDDVWISPLLVHEVRGAVGTFLERSLRDGDQAILGNTNGDMWWSARMPEGREDLLAVLRRFQGRQFSRRGSEEFVDTNVEGGPVRDRVLTLTSMTEYRAFEILRHGNGDMAMAMEVDAFRRARMRLTFAAIQRALDALASLRGRRSLLLFTQGFIQDLGPELRQVANAAREANVAIHFIDVRGLRTSSIYSASEAGAPDPREFVRGDLVEPVLDNAGSMDLADDTGGVTVRNTNDLAGGTARIARESGAFYLLGFHPPAGKPEGTWRKLKVEVKRKGLRVRARRGYSLGRAVPDPPSPKPGGTPAVHPDVEAAIVAAGDHSGVPLQAMVYAFEPRGKDMTRVLVAAELDAATVVKPQEAVTSLEFSVLVRARDNPRGWRQDGRLEFRTKPGEAPAWRAFTREFELPAGVAQVRVVVRDTGTGQLGSVVQRFEIERPDAFRLSTPIVTDQAVPAEKGQKRPRPALAVHRTFAPGATLYCEFEVFGASRASSVTAGVELRTRAGQAILQAAATPIAPDSDGRRVRFMGIPLAGLQEGAYELVLRIEDAERRARVERREPFVLAP